MKNGSYNGSWGVDYKCLMRVLYIYMWESVPSALLCSVIYILILII